jgi:hypothetical protein
MPQDEETTTVGFGSGDGSGGCRCECQTELRAMEAELRTLQKRMEAMAQISRMENDLLIRRVAEAESACAATRGAHHEFSRQLEELRLDLVEVRSFASALAADTRSLKIRSTEEREERSAFSREQQGIKEVAASLAVAQPILPVHVCASIVQAISSLHTALTATQAQSHDELVSQLRLQLSSPLASRIGLADESVGALRTDQALLSEQGSVPVFRSLSKR